MTTFDQLGVRADILRAIKELGFESPMPIQEMVIPHLLTQEGDVVGLAQTGTGKTAAFGLPVLQRIDTDLKRPQALIIAPTRELCLQIAGDLADFAKYVDGLSILPVYGGSSIESQIRTLRKGVQVVVATPGRLIDLIKRGEVTLNHVHTVILDEADEMLNMGFIDDINEILTFVPDERKMLMFSATMPKEIAAIAKDFMHDPVEFVAGQRNEGSKNVKHVYYLVKAQDKYHALKRVADHNPNIYGIVFCRTRKDTQDVADKLIADGYNADCLHGDLSQAQRDYAMKKFREHTTQLLVATDVAARGLDVDDLTHVVNYSLPDDVAVYTHRSGRTGRANKTGVSIAIIHSREKSKLRLIEQKVGISFEHKNVPTPERIIEKQLYNLADRLERVDVNDETLAQYIPGVKKKLEWLSGEDLLKRILSLELNRLLKYYQDMPVIDLDDTTKKNERNKANAAPKKDKDRRVAEEGYERVYLNLGKYHGFFPGNLMDIVNKHCKGDQVEIGRIDLLSDYTLFDVRAKDAKRVIGSLKNANFFGTRVYAEVAVDGKDYSRKRGKRDDKEEPRQRRGRKDREDFVADERPRERRHEERREEPAKPRRSKADKYPTDFFDFEPAQPNRKKRKREPKAEKKHHGNYEVFKKKK